jgi:hypothetical protein
LEEEEDEDATDDGADVAGVELDAAATEEDGADAGAAELVDAAAAEALGLLPAAVVLARLQAVSDAATNAVPARAAMTLLTFMGGRLLQRVGVVRTGAARWLRPKSSGQD